jgi:hypothetical protein
MGNEVLNYKSKPPKVKGITTINHGIRVRMGLGCMEYVLMDAIVELLRQKKPVTDVLVYQKTGLVPAEATMTLEMLVKKGFVYPAARADGAPALSPKWSSFFTVTEEEFMEFWQKEGKNCWTGSKPKARELYIKARKEHDKKFLLERRDAYFNHLDVVKKGGFDRSPMMATVFLGSQERFLEPWEEYTEKEVERQKKIEESKNKTYPEAATMPSTETSEDRRKKYEN